MKFSYYVNVYEKFAEKPNKMMFKFEDSDSAVIFAESVKASYEGFTTIAVTIDIEKEAEE